MNRLLCVLAVALLLPATSSALFEEECGTARGYGLGCSLAADPHDPSGRSVNPAAGSWLDGWSAEAAFSRPFGLRELDRVRIDGALRITRTATGGLTLTRFGSPLYAEQAIHATFSYTLFPRLALGVGLTHARVHIDRYGDEGAWMLDAGALLALTRASFGLSVSRARAGRYNRFNVRPTPAVHLAGRVPVDPRATVYAELDLPAEGRGELSFGAEAEVMAGLRLRLGYESVARRIHLGFGLALHALAADGSYDHHPLLGWTSAFGLSWKRDRSHAAP